MPDFSFFVQKYVLVDQVIFIIKVYQMNLKPKCRPLLNEDHFYDGRDLFVSCFIIIFSNRHREQRDTRVMIPDSQSVKTEFPPGNEWHQFLLFVLSELWPVKEDELKSG